MTLSHAPIHDFEPHQEEDLVPSGPLVRTAIVAVIIGAIGVFFGGLIVIAATGSIVPNVAGRFGTRPAPRQIDEIEQTQIWKTRRGIDLRDAQRAELGRWGWANRDHRIARIPIDEAMDLVVEQEAKHR